jgi:hypothetical protein
LAVSNRGDGRAVIFVAVVLAGILVAVLTKALG